MLRNIIICFIISMMSLPVLSENLSAFFYYSRFTTPSSEPYIETYISIAGNTAVFKEVKKGSVQATIEVTMLFKQDSVIKEFRKYNLTSPVYPDTTEFFSPFIDLQRIPLPNGKYNFELYLKDINAENPKVFKYFEDLVIDFPKDSLAFSDIEIVEQFEESEFTTKYTKNGFHLIPYVSNFFPEKVEKLGFYLEAYNLNKKLGMDEGFLIRYYFETYHSNQQLEDFSFFQKQLASPVNIVMQQIPITQLPSGNYNLIVEFRDKQNNLLNKDSYFFQRSNPSVEINFDNIATLDISGTFSEKITDIDSLSEYIKYLHPISNQVELTYADNQLKGGDKELMQKFFYSFWSRRNNLQPEQEWKDYLAQVNYVNRFYSSQIKKGYETDRGRVYLQYGTPNSITDRKFESQYYPYEIWHYYETENQRNVKFVYYKPNLAVNEYVLIHSTAKGEIVNPNWEKMLRLSPGDDQDDDQKAIDDFDLVR